MVWTREVLFFHLLVLVEDVSNHVWSTPGARVHRQLLGEGTGGVVQLVRGSEDGSK